MRSRVVRVDIDNTICKTDGYNYAEAKPIPERIEKINKLYYDGCVIIYWSGRGQSTKIDYEPLTRYQLDSWGCKYDDIQLTKPMYDQFIDDKSINSEDYFA